MSGSPHSSLLRYGVMCDASGLPQFARACIQQLAGITEPSLLIVNDAPPQYTSRKDKLRKAFRLDGNLWYLQNRLFPVQDIPPYRKSSLDECFHSLPRFQCAVTRRGGRA